MRQRLTLWYTALVGAMLLLFAVISYAALDRVIGRTVDESLEGAVDAYAKGAGIEAGDQDMQGATPDAVVAEAAREFQTADVWLVVFDRAGNVVARVDARAGAAPASDPAVRGMFDRVAARGSGQLEAAGAGRLYAASRTLAGREYVVVAGRSTAEQAEALAAVRTTFYVTVPIAVLVAALVGALLAKKSLEPVAAMASQAERIRAATLDRRLPVTRPDDELGRLAITFNELLGRLEDAFEQQRRFMADASHELRTPVAVVRGEAEVALANPVREADEYRESLAIVLDEGKRLGRVVDELFLLARADAGQVPLERSVFAIDDLVSDAVLSVRSIAAGRGVAVEIAPAGRADIDADEALVGRMLRNLLDNAIRHAPEGTAVRVGVTVVAGDVVIEVEDHGPGIPESAQPHVFKRFYRADAARGEGANGQGGAGLGLAIARWVAEAHGGSLELVRSSGAGTVFAARLPR